MWQTGSPTIAEKADRTSDRSLPQTYLRTCALYYYCIIFIIIF